MVSRILKSLFLIVLVSAVTLCSAQKKLHEDLSVPIPPVKFDEKGEFIITASATSASTDFDFLIGKWTLKHEKLRTRLNNCKDWDEFENTVEDVRILEGLGNMDVVNSIVNGKPWEGRTIRLFNPKTRLWSLHWVASDVAVMDPPVVGSFENGIGHFFTKDTFQGKPIIMMFRWDKRNPEKPIWSQAFSPDNGKTWEWNHYNVSIRVK